VQLQKEGLTAPGMELLFQFVGSVFFLFSDPECSWLICAKWSSKVIVSLGVPIYDVFSGVHEYLPSGYPLLELFAFQK
jgi:hypothetical protein